MLLDENWALVTKNSIDFRGPSDSPGSKGQFAGLSVQPGLICINGPAGMDLALQSAFFSEALDQLDVDDDLTNQVLEITCEDDQASVEVVRYQMPAD